MVFTYTPVALKPTAELIRNLEPLVKGEAARARRDRAEALRRAFACSARRAWSASRSPRSTWRCGTRWHAATACRSCACSAASRSRFRRYGAVGYDGVADSAKVAEDWAKRGFTGIKAKIGYPTVQEDVAVIRAMRKAVGDDVAIMVDYNQCLTPAEAVERLRVLDDEGLTWVEEPTLAHDYAGHALIAREARTPIQCGENWWGTLDMQHAIDAQRVRLHDAGRHEDRRRDGLDARRGARAGQGHPRCPATCGPRSARNCFARRRPRTGSNTPTGGTRS